jgi:hypothetical protein
MEGQLVSFVKPSTEFAYRFAPLPVVPVSSEYCKTLEKAHLYSEHGPGIVERSGLPQNGLPESWLPECSCPKRLHPQKACSIHRVAVLRSGEVVELAFKGSKRVVMWFGVVNCGNWKLQVRYQATNQGHVNRRPN